MTRNTNNVSKAIKIFWIAFSILLLISGWATSYGILRASVGNHEERLSKNEEVIQRIDKSLVGIEKDISYIKEKIR